MANNKQRYINTRIWNDTYVSKLDPTEKLLFIYFLTNEHTNISGIYEIPEKIIAIETGIDTSMVEKILPRLEDKIRYIDGKVVIQNFLKHQLGIGNKISEFVIKGILNCLHDLDQEWLKNVVKQGYYNLPKDLSDTLYIPYVYPSKHSNSNSNINIFNNNTKQAKTSFAKKVKVSKKELKVLEPWSFEGSVKKLEDSPRRDLNIIAYYLDERRPDIKNRDQMVVAVKRHLRAAKLLISFTDDQILLATKKAKDATPEWTLETLVKYLTK